MIKAKHVSEKNLFCSINVDKIREKEFLKSYDGLLSCHLTCTGRPAHPAGFNGAVQLSPYKDNVQFQKFFCPQVFLYS